MKKIYLTSIFSMIFVLEVLFSTVVYGEPSFAATDIYLEGVNYITIDPKDVPVNFVPLILIIGLLIISIVLLVINIFRLQQKEITVKICSIKDFELPALLSIMQVAFLIRLFFLSTYTQQSDEGIYTYTSYLVANGSVLYKDVLLAHTPLSIYITAFFISFFKPTYPSIRIISLFLFTSTIALTYQLSKIIFVGKKVKYSLIVAALYAFYPSWFITFSFTSTLENLFALLTLSTIITYAIFHKSKKRRYIILSGFFGGCALTTTLRAMYFLIPLIVFHVIYLVWKRKARDTIKDGLLLILGLIIPIGIMLVHLTLSGSLDYFYLNVIVYQISLFPKSGFLFNLLWYFNNMWPLLLLGGLGAFSAINMTRITGKISMVIPSFLFLSNLLFILSGVLSGGFFIHYLYYLCPLAAIVAVLGALRLKSSFSINKKNKLLSFFLIVLLFTIGVTVANTVTITLPYFSQFPYDKVDNYIGTYIHNITSPSDSIWSGEATIGFFSERTITAPDSDFRFIGLYDWAIGFDFGVDRGTEMKGFTNGFVNTDDFVQSWENNKVEILVFIMNKGWVPYIDPLLWNGYRNQTGVSEYVIKNYNLREIVTCNSKFEPHKYYIWSRKE